MDHGSKWVELTQYLPNKYIFILFRNDNDIKNRFYCCIRHVQKQLNAAQKLKKIKSEKLISHESLLTVLEIGKFDYNSLDNRFVQIKQNVVSILEARDLIIELAQKTEVEVESSKVQQLTRLLVELKHCLKFINIKRVKKSAQKGVSSVSSTNKRNADEAVAEQSQVAGETK